LTKYYDGPKHKWCAFSFVEVETRAKKDKAMKKAHKMKERKKEERNNSK
jgi:hypothetical protein